MTQNDKNFLDDFENEEPQTSNGGLQGTLEPRKSTADKKVKSDIAAVTSKKQNAIVYMRENGKLHKRNLTDMKELAFKTDLGVLKTTFNAEIAALKTEIAALKAENAEMKEQITELQNKPSQEPDGFLI